METMRVLLPTNGRPIRTIADYEQTGGYQGLTKALTQMRPEDVILEVKRAGLRGRGGAGYPTGLKWAKGAVREEEPKYFCCNAAEGEPGTLKDRHLMRQNPYQVLEGLVIGAYAVGARQAYLCIKEYFTEEIQALERAIVEATARGYLGRRIVGTPVGIELTVIKGPGSYLLGEETGMLEVIEGHAPMPRPSPPYPTERGLFGKPTVVNNAETLSNVPNIIRRGADWFRGIGTSQCPGTMLFSLTGAVARPGVYELPMGTPLRELIYMHGGGIRDGRRLKAVFPGGPSNGLLTEASLDVGMDFDSLSAAGSGLGSGGPIVFDESACLVRTALDFCTFFMRESCGQCPTCRMGTANLAEALRQLEDGEGTDETIARLDQIPTFVNGTGLCTVVDGAANVVESTMRFFRPEYLAHVRQHGCPLRSARLLH